MEETILIVDDNPDNLGVLKGMLERGGYRVRPADSGRMALASLRVGGVDLIMLDIMMPGMDGYELCRTLKGEAATRDIPVIFISGLNDPLDKVKAFDAGGVDYVTKPFHEQEVLARVRTHLQLHQLRRRLERHNEELEQVVAERTAALRASNEGLQKALRVRQEFLSLVSHELRTPLNGILGMATLLEHTLPANRREEVGLIKESGWGLLRLIDDMLRMVQQGEAARPEPADRIEDLNRLCEACLMSIRPLADRKRIAVEIDLPDAPLPALTMPRDRIHQAVANLLDNAVRFTPEGGRIGLRVLDSAGLKQLIIEVWDTGEGIPDADKARIFEPFVQLDAVLTRRHGGLGLGLTLARQFVQLHGGSIDVGDRPGGGSVFSVRLPVRE